MGLLHAEQVGRGLVLFSCMAIRPKVSRRCWLETDPAAYARRSARSERHGPLLAQWPASANRWAACHCLSRFGAAGAAPVHPRSLGDPQVKHLESRAGSRLMWTVAVRAPCAEGLAYFLGLAPVVQTHIGRNDQSNACGDQMQDFKIGRIVAHSSYSASTHQTAS